MRFNHRNICQCSRKFLDYGPANIHMGDFTTSENEGDLGLVAFFQEASHMLDLEIQIVVIGLGAKLYLLDLDMYLFLSCFLKFFTLLIFELAIIHDPTDRRHRTGGHLYQIKLLLFGERKGLGG